MKKKILFLLIVITAIFRIAFISCVLSAHASFYKQQKTLEQYVPNQLIIKFKSPDEKIVNEILDKFPVKVVRKKRVFKHIDKIIWKYNEKRKNTANIRSLKNIFFLEIDNNSLKVPDIINIVKKDENIEYIEPNYIYSVCREPNDPYYHTEGTWGQPYEDLWGLRKIHAGNAWDVTTGSHDILVAVIDTGIDYNHPDLGANIWMNPGEDINGVDDDENGYIDDLMGWNFADGNNDPIDNHGHGTHCAGIIGAVGNNGKGVVGVNWNVSIVGLKGLQDNGEGTHVNLAAAIEYAILIGADILSNSWGGGGYSETLRSAIELANDNNIPFIAAAGNSGMDTDIGPHYPSSYDVPNIISVAASTPDDNLAGFSNYGLFSVDLAAPGEDILSLRASGTGEHDFVPPEDENAEYIRKSGTSMACPHVAGAAALIKTAFHDISFEELKNRLIYSVDILPALEDRTYSGGRLNLVRCLETDNTAPDAIENLAASRFGSVSVKLIWSASGDDGDMDRASFYDIRYSESPITEENFNSAIAAKNALHPKEPGEYEEFIIDGLDLDATYYFAIRTGDNIGNLSALSNVAGFTIERLIPETIEINRGNNQHNLENNTLVEPLEVIVRDASGIEVYDVAVEFNIVNGDGALSEGTVLTDVHGRASTNLILGTVPDGSYTADIFVEASVFGVESPAVFTATAVRDFGFDFNRVWDSGHILNPDDNLYPRIPTCLAVGDVDNDGKPEIIGSSYGEDEYGDINNRIHVFKNTGDNDYEELWQSEGIPIVAELNSIAIGDTDGDNLEEIIAGRDCVVMSPYGEMYIYEHDGEGSFILEDTISVRGGVKFIEVVDIDSDGLDEIIVIAGCCTVKIYEHSGAPGENIYTERHIYSFDYRISKLTIGDSDNDGRKEIIVNDERVNNENTILINRFEYNRFTTTYEYKSFDTGIEGTAPLCHEVGDIDNDGLNELLIGGHRGEILIFKSDANDSYQLINNVASVIPNPASDLKITSIIIKKLGSLPYPVIIVGAQNDWFSYFNMFTTFTGENYYCIYSKELQSGSLTAWISIDDTDLDNSTDLVFPNYTYSKIYVYEDSGPVPYSFIDTTPPTIPVVSDEGEYTENRNRLSASWSSSDPESGIVEYVYEIRADSPSGNVIDVGSTTENSVTVEGYRLLYDGRTYYFCVRAINGFRLESDIGISDGITVDLFGPCITDKTVEEGRTRALKRPVTFKAKVVDNASGVKEAKLMIRRGRESWDTYPMGDPDGDSIYSVRLGSSLSLPVTIYKIVATDNLGHQTESRIYYIWVIP